MTDPSRGWAVTIACGLMLCAGAPAFAQQGQGQGQGQTGGSQTGGTGGLGGGLGGSGSNGGGTGSGGVDTGGTGELGGGLAGPALMTFGDTVDATGGTGFAGRGNAAQNFVGGLVQGQGQTGPGGLGGRGGNNSMFQGLNRQGQFRQGVQQPTGPSRAERVRPRHRIAFEFSPRRAATVTTNLQTRLTSLPAAPAGVNASLSPQGVATLSGSVVNEHSARLAAALARLEPGVRDVDNQLSIAGSE